jgi:hypothetical protein
MIRDVDATNCHNDRVNNKGVIPLSPRDGSDNFLDLCSFPCIVTDLKSLESVVSVSFEVW